MRQTCRKRTLSNATKEEGRGIEQGIGHESRNKILETLPSELPEEIAQNVWEALKEEFHACKFIIAKTTNNIVNFAKAIEQLPLSFHRTFSLISEQDREAQGLT